MKVIVVHEDGDKWERTYQLYREVMASVAEGSMQHQGVITELIKEEV